MIWPHTVGAGCLFLLATLLAAVSSLGPREAHADTRYADAARVTAEGDVNAAMAVGRYALISFVPDATDGRPHFLHGFATDIQID